MNWHDDSDDPKKRRRRHPFDDMFNFDEFEPEFEKIVEEMGRMFEDAFKMTPPPGACETPNNPSGTPFVYGFSMRFGPDGKPIISNFGTKNRKQEGVKEDESTVQAGEREPLVDITECGDEISITAELPGVKKEDIDLSVTDDELTIHVDSEKRKYHKSVALPKKVNQDTTRATYNNGILDVVIKRKDRSHDGKKITIE